MHTRTLGVHVLWVELCSAPAAHLISRQEKLKDATFPYLFSFYSKSPCITHHGGESHTTLAMPLLGADPLPSPSPPSARTGQSPDFTNALQKLLLQTMSVEATAAKGVGRGSLPLPYECCC